MKENTSSVTASLEGYHHRSNRFGRLTLMGEIDGANIGKVEGGVYAPAQVSQFGVSQLFPIGEQAAVILGYQNLFGFGESLENRPSVAAHYGFKNGLYLSHRTRYHHGDYVDSNTTRFDNVVGYKFNGYDTYVQHIHFTTGSKDDFQWRVVKQNDTFSPFVELRTQNDRDSSALVVGVNLSI